MSTEQTLVLVKPDGIMMGCADAIKKRYIEAGLTVIQEGPVRFSRDEVMDFYQEHAGRFYFPALLLSMTDHLCRGFILEGENAIQKVRDLNGPTNPSEAPEGTIRRDFRSGGGPFNTVHSSDSRDSFKRELYIYAVAAVLDVEFIRTP